MFKWESETTFLNSISVIIYDTRKIELFMPRGTQNQNLVYYRRLGMYITLTSGTTLGKSNINRVGLVMK